MCESNCSRPIVRQHFSFPQDISRMAIFSEFNICTFLLRASQRPCLFGEISGVRDVDFALNCRLCLPQFPQIWSSGLFPNIFHSEYANFVPVVPDASFLRSSFQSLFCVYFPDFDLAEPFEVLPRNMSGECFGGACAVLPVQQVASFPTSFQFLVSFTSSDQAIHFQGFSHQYARTS